MRLTWVDARDDDSPSLSHRRPPDCCHNAAASGVAGVLDGRGKDLPSGSNALNAFRSFLMHLGTSDLSKRTIERHIDKL
jgi:hypothetical protein